jgi:5-methyltetrahydrofolate--homocysteine methyltransferase
MSEDVLKQLREAILGLDGERAKALTTSAIKAGIAPLDVVESALRPSLEQLGDDFEAEKIFLPELVAVGNIAGDVGDIVEEAMLGDESAPKQGAIALGTVKGDIHSIGKNIVAVMMKAYGFRVNDLGVDVSPEEFLDAAPEADVVAMSGLLTTATRTMKDVIERVSDQYPGKVIITGGAAMNPELAKALGVLYGPDAATGVRMLGETLA